MCIGGVRAQHRLKATGTVGIPSASTQQDEKRPRAWLITVQVI
jgi:hypothetical protein